MGRVSVCGSEGGKKRAMDEGSEGSPELSAIFEENSQILLVPSWFSMSATSSLPTTPSLSRSNIWNPSRNSRTCPGCNFETAFMSPAGREEVSIVLDPGIGRFAPRVGDTGDSRCDGTVATKPRGVHVSASELGLFA